MNSIVPESALPGASETQIRGARWLAVTAIVIVFASFLVMTSFGVVMRMNQGRWLSLDPSFFYSILTLHGLMQVGALFAGSLYGVWFVLVRHAGIRANTGFMWLMLLATMVGMLGIVIGTLVGRYAPGWYMLYPIEFSLPTWQMWAMAMVTSALLLLGLVWTGIMLSLLHSMGRRYGYGNLFGLQYLGREKPSEELPPIILITTVIAIAAILGMLSGAAFLIMLLIEWINPAVHFNVLMEKNVVFFFGHTIANVTLYFVVGIMYEMMPRFTGRPWKCNRVIVYSWLATLVMVVGVFSHHLYMDFAQPVWAEYVGQILSYASAIPATVVTVFGLIAQVYRLGVKRWKFVPATFALGTVGWVTGGFAAVVDSTISNNLVLHNTLWVNAHFHTYYLEGVFVWLLGVGFYLVGSRAERLAKSALAIMVVTGYGFLTMFYLAGVFSVPRRYADYTTTGFANHILADHGAWTAEAGAVLMTLFLLGYLVYLASLGFTGRDSIAEPDSTLGWFASPQAAPD
ncbi:MAG: cbb3-type cytochrome c oxidase subunit I [Gammaproteobacteria bacterium]